MRLHYLVKLKIGVFCENSNAGKAKLEKLYILTLILLTEKCNFLTLTSRDGKFNQEYMYQTLSKSASFCKRYGKNILVFFFGSQLSPLFTCKTWMLSFTRYSRDTVQVRWTTFTFLYDKFTQDNVCQILLQSVRFRRLHIKILVSVFRFTVYIFTAANRL